MSPVVRAMVIRLSPAASVIVPLTVPQVSQSARLGSETWKGASITFRLAPWTWTVMVLVTPWALA